MIKIYEKPDEATHEMRQHAFGVGEKFLLPQPNGCVPIVTDQRGKPICTCETYLQRGYCSHMELVDIVQHPQYGFRTREIPRAVIRDSKTGIVWVLTDNIYSVKDSKCKCSAFRASGTCNHIELAKS